MSESRTENPMLRAVLAGLAALTLFFAMPACGDETPHENAHVCHDGQHKCEGDLVRSCSNEEWGPAKDCPSGQVCVEMDGGGMCM